MARGGGAFSDEEIQLLRGLPAVATVLTAMYGASEPDNATGRAIHELFDGETDWVCEKRIPFSPETKWSGNSDE